MRILQISIVFYFILILNSCFSGIKKNIDNLKNCEINIVNLIFSTEPKQNFSEQNNEEDPAINKSLKEESQKEITSQKTLP